MSHNVKCTLVTFSSLRAVNLVLHENQRYLKSEILDDVLRVETG
jgi:hypothetical protein